MNPDKKTALEKAGFVFGDADDFLRACDKERNKDLINLFAEAAVWNNTDNSDYDLPLDVREEITQHRETDQLTLKLQ